MDVRHLDLLRDLSVRGTLAAVAEATHRTPSAVSQQLRTAEREFGVALVEPVGRGLRLTAAGQVLADGACDVSRVIAEVQAQVDALTGAPHGVVRIGTLPSAGEVLLPPLMSRFRESAITLEVDDFDIVETEFAARTLDADIVIAHSLTGDVPDGADGLTCVSLAREPIDVAIPEGHPLADLPALTPGDLVGCDWIGVPAGYPFDSIVIAVEHLTDSRIERRVRLRDNRMVEALVASGEGLALLPRFTTRERPGVVLRPLEGVRSSRSIVALCRPDRYARYAVRSVTEALVEIGASVTATSGER